jgi:hypothetical protein
VDVTGSSIFSDGAVANTLTLNVQATANTFLYGQGTNTNVAELGPLADGELIIGATGGAPAAANLTSTDGSITITNGTNSIDLAVAASDDAILTLTGDAGGAVSPTAGNIDIQGVTVANAANAKPLFIQGTPGSSLLEAHIQVAAAVTGAPGDKLDAGVASFDASAFTVDTDGYVQLVGPFGPQVGAYNLGLTYSAGTATIKGADGNDLSATNPGFVVIPSNVTNGKLITYTLTSNVTFDDANGASSIFAGSLFGFDTGDDTSTIAQGGGIRSGIVFFLYAIADNTDANLTFAVGQNPSIENSFTSIYDAGSGSADIRFDRLTVENVTIANYENVAMTMIGCFNATLNGSDDWVITDVDMLDGFGINRYYGGLIGIPLGTKGSTTNSVFIDNGGTAPTINTTTSFCRYQIDYFGRSLNVYYNLILTGSPSGAANIQMLAPNIGRLGQRSVNVAGYLVKTGTAERYPITMILAAPNNNHYFTLPKVDGTSGVWQYEELDSGDSLILQISLAI